MHLEKIDDVIATRKLFVADEPGRTILVIMGRPQPFPDQHLPDQEDYYCPYQITGIGDEHVMASGGVDAFQAVELGLRMIGAELAAYNRDLGGRLRWECDEEGGLGFPIPAAFQE